MCPFCGGELGTHVKHNVAEAAAYLHAKFHLDPSNRLATMRQHHRQDRQTGQRSDTIGRTVLQTVAQKIGHMTMMTLTTPIRE